MIRYVRGDQVAFESIYQGFTEGFSDYVIKLEMTLEQFKDRFFGPEGNDLAYSYVALDEDKPVGVVLGGIRVWDGLKTLRCGTLCVSPDYRGKQTGQEQISEHLMKLHYEIAKTEQCERLSLEVIKANERAVKFYEKQHYFAANDLKYYRMKAETLLSDDSADSIDKNSSLVLKSIEYAELAEARRAVLGLHIHWQAEVDYYKDSQADQHFSIEAGGLPVGYLSATPQGKLNYLWIDPAHRGKGYGRAALVAAIDKMGMAQLVASFVNNNLLEGFFRGLNFDKDAIEQYEMFRLMS